MIYTVPTSKANDFLRFEDYIVTSDEAEAVSMACGYYLATGDVATVVIGDNGLLNALDALISLSQLHEIPVNLQVYVRNDEPQHKMVTDKIPALLEMYNIKAEIHGN